MMSPLNARAGLVLASNKGWDGKPMREVALTLVEHGWPVFPCGLDKAPLVAAGFKARTKNVQQVEQWWALHPEALPAICPGDNGLAAIDVDSPGAWLRVESVHVSCLAGLVVESGGTSEPFSTADGQLRQPRHVYVQAESAPKIAGVVVRYLAGYVIAPGARRGVKVYRVTSSEAPAIWTGERDQQKPLPGVEPVANPSLLRRVETLIAAIPNPLENGREPYIAMAHMIHGAVGGLGRDVFLEWAGRWPGKVNRAEDERVWDSLPASQLGFEDLWILASKYTDTSAEQRAAAQGDFDILGPRQPDPEQPVQRAGYWIEELQTQPELLAVPTPCVPYLAWPGRKTLFAGREKSGKSTMTFAAIAHVTRGEPFLGTETIPQRVLWLTEEALGDVTRRGTEMEVAPTRKLYVVSIDQNPWRQLADAFKEIAPQVVVIDSLAWFAGLSESEENNSGAWLPVFKNFDKLTKAGAALILLHHSTKSSPVGGYRGSTALGAYVDAILEMVPPQNGTTYRNIGGKGRMGLGRPFNVRMTDEKRGKYKLVQGVEELKATALEDEIEAYRAQHADVTVGELAKALGKRKAAIIEALDRLVRRKGDFEPVEAM
jgi:hypothetical protein